MIFRDIPTSIYLRVSRAVNENNIIVLGERKISSKRGLVVHEHEDNTAGPILQHDIIFFSAGFDSFWNTGNENGPRVTGPIPHSLPDPRHLPALSLLSCVCQFSVSDRRGSVCRDSAEEIYQHENL